MQGHVNNIVHARKTDKQVARWDAFKSKAEVSEKTRIRILAQRLTVTEPRGASETLEGYAERLAERINLKPWAMEPWQVLTVVDRVVSAGHRMSNSV